MPETKDVTLTIKINPEPVKDVIGERLRQEAKWGQQDHPPGIWLGILGEEFGEVCKEIAESQARPLDVAHLREELIQTAAVAVAWVEAIDRGLPADADDAQRLALELIADGLFTKTLSESVGEASSHEKAQMIARAGIQGRIDRLQQMKEALDGI